MFGRSGALSLTQRLFVLTAVALVPAFAIVAYNVLVLRQDREQEIHDQARQTGVVAALEMERIVYGAEDVLRAVAVSPEIADAGQPACNELLREVDGRIERFRTLRLVDRTGEILCTSESVLSDLDLAGRPYLAEALEAGRFVVGTYTLDRVDGAPVLPLALPLDADADGAGRVLVGTLDLAWLGSRLLDREYAEDNALTIADRDGVIIAREPFPERFVGTRIPDAFQHLVRADRPGTLEVVSQDGTRRVIGYVPASAPPVGLYVSAGISSDTAFEPLDDAATLTTAMAVAGLVLAFGATWFTGRALVRRPVDRLLSTIDAWRRGDERARTGMQRAEGEIGAVGEAIDGYMDDLVADRKLRREADAHRELLLRELDHRVKNILATVQAIARQTFRPDVDPTEAMAVYGARLTAIASAHALLISSNWRSADLADVVEAAIRPFRAEGDRRFDVAGPPLVTEAKAALAFSMALHELSTNSVKYGALAHDDGRVRIGWSVTESESGPQFRFSWTEQDGPPVRPPERKGFGSTMIERLLAAELEAAVELRYPPTGAVCVVECPLAAVIAEPAPTPREHAPRPPQPESRTGIRPAFET